MQNQKRILICPLNWGLGHATRCIPIIRLLLQKNQQVLIAADGRPLALLKKEFPQLVFIDLKGYDINYTTGNSLVLKMLFSIPKILKGIRDERTQLEKIIAEHKIDIVISDNRYGCWSKKVKSIFITHQLMMKSPLGEGWLHRLILNYVKRYDECWIPDVEGDLNLSGDLAHQYKLPKNTYFIGSLSRFEKPATNSPLLYDVMAIISGPEPQRSIFEKLLVKQISDLKIKALLVLGKTELEQERKNDGTIEIVNHLQMNEMQQAILQSKIIIARSGYSTLMDLAALSKRAIFIPTPGQTEQEYLAEMMMQKKIAFSQTQTNFNLKEALIKSETYTGFKNNADTNKLENRIDLF
jgi:uncharacterized protein (TIGR00661 family)